MNQAITLDRAAPAEQYQTRAGSPRLLIVTTIAATARAFLLPTAQYFRREGWQVDLAAKGAPECGDCAGAFDTVFDIEWARSPLDPANAGAARAIRRIAANGRYDLIHVHTPVAAFVSRFALRGLRRSEKFKVIYTAHGLHFHSLGGKLSNMVFRTLERVAGKWTDYVVVMNREDFASAKACRLVPPARVRFMPGIGVDVEQYGPSSAVQAEAAAIRRSLGLNANDFLFLMAAEFIPRKRHEDALRAFTSLGLADVHLAFAGNGPLEKQSREFAAQSSASGRIHFLGVRNDIPALLAAAQALVLPSLQEGLPRCILEAMCAGLPAIGSAIRGTSDLLGEGAGILFPAGNVEALVEAMLWMAQHRSEAAAMGKRGREQAKRYDSAEILSLHEQLYREALCTRTA